jgi:putative transposase
MNDIQSLSHSKWRCQYHIVFASKYRRKEIYGQIKADIGVFVNQKVDQALT